MATKSSTILDPRILGFWVRCMRETQKLSQEAVAAASGLDVRTIQRIESGQAASVTTRRCLARGLGYEDQDKFDDPTFAANVERILKDMRELCEKEREKEREKELEKEYPNHIRIKAERVLNGNASGRFADISTAVLLHADDEISEDARQSAAVLFDYIRDLLDLGSDISFSQKQKYWGDLETLLRELEAHGVAAYSAFRSTKMVGANWADKTPLPLEIGYLTVVPENKSSTK